MKTQAGNRTDGRRNNGAPAFTRLELAAVLIGLTLLALIVLPALANNCERSERVLCGNNLRLIGQAYAQWGTEHSGRVPVRTFWWDGGLQSVGGTPPPGSVAPPWMTAGFQNNAWFHWAWISNELRTPKILACPSDVEKLPATNFTIMPGGFLNAGYRDRAVSYLISLDVLAEQRLALLSGDRNVIHTSIASACSSGVAPCRSLELRPPPTTTRIDGRLHGGQGNFLLTDGRVEEWSGLGLIRRMVEIYGPLDDPGTVAHYLTP